MKFPPEIPCILHQGRNVVESGRSKLSVGIKVPRTKDTQHQTARAPGRAFPLSSGVALLFFSSGCELALCDTRCKLPISSTAAMAEETSVGAWGAARIISPARQGQHTVQGGPTVGVVVVPESPEFSVTFHENPFPRHLPEQEQRRVCCGRTRSLECCFRGTFHWVFALRVRLLTTFADLCQFGLLQQALREEDTRRRSTSIQSSGRCLSCCAQSVWSRWCHDYGRRLPGCGRDQLVTQVAGGFHRVVRRKVHSEQGNVRARTPRRDYAISSSRCGHADIPKAPEHGPPTRQNRSPAASRPSRLSWHCWCLCFPLGTALP
mmetsp:Transcript_22297/g.48516  ORF Transcript_22297/g.48516 Transcript_22297/m.48516 type:complete len:320 (-) Transcript_22297:195-1154(-)